MAHAAAKHRAIDFVRRGSMLERKHGELGYTVESARPDTAETLNAALDDDIGDDLLRLVFTACHPVLTTEARVALTLRLLGGLTTSEIARAFLRPRADRSRSASSAPRRRWRRRTVPYEVPRGDELAPRLSSVLEVVYLIFNEGYSATAGDDWMRPALCDEALRLGRILAELAPQEPEVHGLGGADGNPGVARAGPRRSRRRADPAARSEPRRCGINC
jgi:predicted RNA polymerase sigma factor